MKRIVIAVAASFVLAGLARAQTAFVTFTTVDAVQTTYDRLTITGVKAGETAATTQSVLCPVYQSDGKCAAFYQNCERLALLAMTKPGQYLLTVVPGGTYTSPDCKLERVAP